MDNNKKIIFIKIVCLILLLSGCLALFSSCSKEPEMVYEDGIEERACELEYESYDYILSADRCEKCFVKGIFVLDDDVEDDQILLDVQSSLNNGVVSINYGGNFSDESVKMYTPVRDFKLSKAGIYYILFDIDFNLGFGEVEKSWIGSTYCLEKGKHYLLVFDTVNNIIERYGESNEKDN